jgi:hypothetical protein
VLPPNYVLSRHLTDQPIMELSDSIDNIWSKVKFIGKTGRCTPYCRETHKPPIPFGGTGEQRHVGTMNKVGARYIVPLVGLISTNAFAALDCKLNMCSQLTQE